MIEMRWLVRPAEKRDGPIFFQDAAHPPDVAYERILQWREGDDIGYGGHWQDVPTVKV